jgi:hypothetical protein
MFILLFYVLSSYGVGPAVLVAAILDVGAALLVGSLSFKSGIELVIITLFVYAGMRIAPLISNSLIS